MKAIKQLIIISMLSLTTCLLQAQEPNVVEIGGRLPNHSLKLFNKAKTVPISELLTTKLLIIDFWATWCVPCLAEIELLDSIKAKYPGEFNVVMVTNEDSTTVKAFFKKYPQYYSKHLNYVTNDTFLNKSFPHRGIPHNIWVNQQGIVKSITGSREVKLPNILNFEKVNAGLLHEKKDNLKFNLRERLDVLNENFTYRSIFGPRAEDLSGMSQSSGPLQTTTNSFTYINGSIFQLLFCAYKFGSFREELVEINTKDSLKFFKPIGKFKQLMDSTKYRNMYEWEAKNTYCYQLVLPSRVATAKLQSYVYQDLERRFNLKIAEIMAPRTVIEVKQKNNALRLQTPSNEQAWITFMPGNKLKIKNATAQQVFDWFFTMHRPSIAPYPYVVELKNTGVINAEIDFSPMLLTKKVESINAAIFEDGMATLGFTFQQKVKNYKILSVQDLN